MDLFTGVTEDDILRVAQKTMDYEQMIHNSFSLVETVKTMNLSRLPDMSRLLRTLPGMDMGMMQRKMEGMMGMVTNMTLKDFMK